jgi:hypothetical protein
VERRRRVDEGRGWAGASTGSADRFGEPRYGVWGGTHKAVLGPDAPGGAFKRRLGPNPFPMPSTDESYGSCRRPPKSPDSGRGRQGRTVQPSIPQPR